MNDYKHEHKFFMFQVKADFSPIAETVIGSGTKIRYTNVFERKEFAVLSCSCGETIKREVKADESDTI